MLDNSSSSPCLVTMLVIMEPAVQCPSIDQEAVQPNATTSTAATGQMSTGFSPPSLIPWSMVRYPALLLIPWSMVWYPALLLVSMAPLMICLLLVIGRLIFTLVLQVVCLSSTSHRTMVTIHDTGSQGLRAILRCIPLCQQCGLKFIICTFWMRPHIGSNLWDLSCVQCRGLSFAS